MCSKIFILKFCVIVTAIKSGVWVQPTLAAGFWHGCSR